MAIKDRVCQKVGNFRRRGAARLDVIVLTAALVLILAACATAKPAGDTAARPSPSESPSVSAPPADEATPSAEMSPAVTVMYPEYALTNSYGGPKLSLGVQNGPYPWDLSFDAPFRTQNTSGDMPGAVFYSVTGDRFRLFYRHIEETGNDVISTFMTTSDIWETARGIKRGDTLQKLLQAYDSGLLYQPKPFPVSQDLGGDICVYDELFIYTRPEDDNCCIVFYVICNVNGDKKITGIQTALGPDGGAAYFADDTNTFAVDDADLDTYLKTDTSAEEKVYSLFNAQGGIDKTALLAAMTDMNWRLYDQLYQPDGSQLLDWLYLQKITDAKDILCVMKSMKGLDGGYAEGYSGILANIYMADSRTFIRLASELDNSKFYTIASMLCYGLSDTKDQVISELEAYRKENVSEKELLLIDGILFYFDLNYSAT